MRRPSTPLFVPAIAILASGCVLLCGPTEYFLSGVTASMPFDAAPDEWERARVAAGLRAAGFEPGRGTECSLGAGANGTSLDANACGQRLTLRVSFDTPDAPRGPRDELEAFAARAIEARRAEVERIADAFASGSGWPRAGSPEWSNGLGHGDC